MSIPWRFAAVLVAAWCAGTGAQPVGIGTTNQSTAVPAIQNVVRSHSPLQPRATRYKTVEDTLGAIAHKNDDFWFLSALDSADALHGRGQWQGSTIPGLRAAITMYPVQFGFWVRSDSSINSIADLKGKRVPAVWSMQPWAGQLVTAALAGGGLAYNDVLQVPVMNGQGAAEDFKADKLDVLFHLVGSKQVRETATAVGNLRLLVMNPLPDSAARIKAVREHFYYSTPSHSSALAFDMIVGAGAHVPDEVVYQFVKALRENKKALAAGYPAFSLFDETPSRQGAAQPAPPPGRDQVFQGGRHLARLTTWRTALPRAVQ